jgi:hypothetical protein
MVVPIRRNNKADEVAQEKGKCDSEYPDIMSHPVDSEAWEALDRFDLEFAWDPRSVRLGLSTDGFHPHNNDSSPYSYWPVFIMPYNLSPNKCLKQDFIFLPLSFRVLRNPKSK